MPSENSTVSISLALASLGALAGAAILGPEASFRALIGVAALALLLAVVSAVRGPAELRSLTLVVACLTALWAGRVLWQLVLAVVVGVALLVARAVPSFRVEPNPLALGRFSAFGVILVGGVTPVALSAWLVLAHPDLSDVVSRYIPRAPMPVLLLGGVVFAIVNAALEEAIWRGLVQSALTRLTGPAMAIAVQAASFGLQHAHGVPRGVIGVVLAGSWAVMLGVLRERTGGLKAPFVAHVIADSTIACIVLFVIRH
jgi:membrane protease YdiL (CAAX protease family)